MAWGEARGREGAEGEGIRKGEERCMNSGGIGTRPYVASMA